MTRHITSPTSTGADSMAANLGAKPKSGKGTPPAWLLRLARRTGYKPSYLKARIFDRDRSWFHLVALTVEEMHRDGHEQLADRRLLELDLIRHGVDPCTAEHTTATVDAIRADAADNAPLAEHLIAPDTGSFQVAERHALNAVRKVLRFSRSGRRTFPRADA